MIQYCSCTLKTTVLSRVLCKGQFFTEWVLGIVNLKPARYCAIYGYKLVSFSGRTCLIGVFIYQSDYFSTTYNNLYFYEISWIHVRCLRRYVYGLVIIIGLSGLEINFCEIVCIIQYEVILFINIRLGQSLILVCYELNNRTNCFIGCPWRSYFGSI